MTSRTEAQWTVSAVVEAPVEKVWETLLEGNPFLTQADRDSIARGTAPFKTSIGMPSEGKITIEVDKQQHSIATQGEWWYRGVQSVEPHAKGSLLMYRVYNIAPGVTWWMAQWVQGPQHARDMRKHLQPTLDAMSHKLNCAAYVA